MQAQQLLTQLSPAKNLYALPLYVFMMVFEKKPPDLLMFLTNPK